MEFLLVLEVMLGLRDKRVNDIDSYVCMGVMFLLEEVGNEGVNCELVRWFYVAYML